MASLLKSFSIIFTSLTIFTAQAYAQYSECSSNDDDRDWAHISTYIEDSCELETCTKTPDDKQISVEDAQGDEHQDNQASRSLDRRKTNNLDEDEIQDEDDDRYTEDVDWRWEGKDKL